SNRTGPSWARGAGCQRTLHPAPDRAPVIGPGPVSARRTSDGRGSTGGPAHRSDSVTGPVARSDANSAHTGRVDAYLVIVRAGNPQFWSIRVFRKSLPAPLICTEKP